MAAAPSTLPANPLEESFARITGLDPMSAETGTAPISYGDAEFRAAGGNAPASDVITISGSPGTGATTAETWSHDIALENQRRQQLEFEYQQQQEEIANQLRAQEAARAAESLGLSKAASAREAAAEARTAELHPYQRESARLGTRTAAAELVPKQLAAWNARREMEMSKALVNQGIRQRAIDIRTPGYTFANAGGGPWYTVLENGQVTSDPRYGRVSQQKNPATGRFYQSQNRSQLLSNNMRYGY